MKDREQLRTGTVLNMKEEAAIVTHDHIYFCPHE